MFCICYTIILLLFYECGFTQIIGKDYGPYTQIWETYETCKGPKSSNCGVFEIESKKNISDIIFAIDFQKDCPLTTAKVVIGSKQSNNVIKKLWNYAIDKPCQHFVLGPILRDSFNLTNNCKIEKGKYKVHINMEQKTTMFLGTNFFYGSFDFKVIVHNKFNNFFCVHSVMIINKA